MAIIDLNTADGATIGNPISGDYFLFLDSNNSDLLTRRDSAGSDTVFGTGEGIDALGWVAITDTTYTSGSPFTILNGVDTALRFNIDTDIDTYAPNGYATADFFDDVNFRVNSPVLGAAYVYRLTFECVPSANTKTIDIAYSIGANIGAKIVIDERTAALRTSGVASHISVSSLVYSLDTFLTNGLQIILNANTDCDIYGITMMIARTS